MSTRNRLMRRWEPARHRRNDFAHVGLRRHLVSSRMSDQHVARNSFLQQKLGCLDNRLGVKAGAHRAVAERVGDALPGSFPDGAPCRSGRSPPVCALGKARRGIVQCLIPAIPAAATRRGKPREIARRSMRIDHRRQRRRVRSDNRVVAETALESQAGHAEARILIGQFQIARHCKRIPIRPTAGQVRRHIRFAAGRRNGCSAPADFLTAHALSGSASGTRTSSRTMRPAPNRSPPEFRCARAETSAESARRPWRSPRNSSGAPRRPAGHNNWNRDCRR